MTIWYARTDVTYKGGDRLFSIPFPYIKKEDIRVFVNDYDKDVDFEFLTPNTILINTPLAIEDIISIRRSTDISEKEVVFTDTSLLDEDSQNLAQDQLLFAVQENLDENARFVEISETVTTSLQQIAESVDLVTEKAQETAGYAAETKETSESALSLIDTKKEEITITADEKIEEINQTAAGYEATIITGRYIGEIIYSLFPIDNPCVKAPSGSVIPQDGIYRKAVTYFKELVKKYPMFSKTEEEWQALKATYGEAPCIVIDDKAGTIRLPLIINPLKGVTDMSQLAQVLEAGLPNIDGHLYAILANNSGSLGAFKTSDIGNINLAGSSDAYVEKQNNYDFDASLSNPIYGNSDTVQPQQPTGCYYMVLATGVEEEVSITNTFEINNPYTLLQPLWSDKKLNNPSWLRSNGQSNPKAEYQTVYDLILEEYNSAADETETVGGVEITFRRGALTGMKVTTDKSAFDSILEAMGTAWYYVIDTANEVFYLPQSDGFMQFGGNGEFVEAGLPNITGNFNPSDGLNSTSAGCFYDSKGNGYAEGSGTPNSSYGHHTFLFDASRSSAVYGKSETVQPNAVKGYLYFYVGETIQNANIVNIGRLEEQLIEKTTPAQAASATLPSSRYTNLTVGASGTQYTMPADGWLACMGVSTANWGWIDMTTYQSIYGVNPNNITTGSTKAIMPIRKGEKVTITYGSVTSVSIRFIYAEGVQ